MSIKDRIHTIDLAIHIAINIATNFAINTNYKF